MSDWLGLAWLGWMDLSQNITPPRAPCGANKQKSLAMIGLQFVRVLKIENKNSHDTPKVVQQTQLSC